MACILGIYGHQGADESGRFVNKYGTQLRTCQALFGTRMSTPGERLREVRLKLGISQEAFGELGGVRKQAQIKYEKGDRKPDTKYLEGIAAAGADVAYILTGTPKGVREALEDVRYSTELAGALGGSSKEILDNQSALFDGLRKARTESAQEEALLQDYRRCTPMDQDVIRQMAARFADDATVKPAVKKRRKKT